LLSHRPPNWDIWKHVPIAKLHEAVALSLNIAPERLRPNLRSWMNGRKFDEMQDFQDRHFTAARNLDTLGCLNFAGVHYDDEAPVVDLKRFAAWAVAIGWELPGELAHLAAVAPADPVVDVRGEEDQTATEGKIYRTGLAGRPSSWHFIEAECRKRWAARERHPNQHGDESPSEWASILKSWFQTEHPEAVQPKQKTLTNRLSQLLHELRSTIGAQNHCPK
jgi:hypothetical protein